MIVGTILSKSVNPYNPVARELYGCYVAEHELLKATLESAPYIMWRAFSTGLRASPTAAATSYPQSPDLGLHQSLFAQRVQHKSFTAWAYDPSIQPDIFVTSAPMMPQMGQFRRINNAQRMPICGLLHSVVLADAAALYTSMILEMRNHDCLVATSAAGKFTIECILEEVGKQFNRAAGYNPLLMGPRVVQIPFGVAVPEARNIDRNHSRHMLRLPDDAFVLLYVGRLSEEYKGDLDVLIRAFANLSKSNPEAWLVLAGQQIDSYAAQLRRRITLLGLSRNTIILENFSDVLKSTLYGACDVFVSPVDSIQETFGLSILEAMAHARPVVASSWSGYRDLVIHGETGFLLDTRWSAEDGRKASKVLPILSQYELSHFLGQRTLIDVDELSVRLRMLADDRQMSAVMGARGRERASQHFNWHSVAKRFYDLWADQIDRGRVQQSPTLWNLDLNSIFGHFADRMISDEDVVTLSSSVNDMDPDSIADLWPFADEAIYAKIQAILEKCSNAKLTIKELKRLGHSRDGIIWLIKKGILHLIPESEIQSL